MTLAIKQGTTKNGTYVVAGGDLAAIWKDIEKKDPKINGNNVAAKTETPFAVNVKFKMKYTPSKKDPGTFDGEFWISGGSIDFNGEILMPKLKSDKDLSKPAKAEWKRFVAKVASHEKEHVDKVNTELKTVAAEMELIIGKANESDKKKSMDEAEKAFMKEYEKNFTGKKLSDRVKKIHIDFDASSKHGAKHGAFLKVSIT